MQLMYMHHSHLYNFYKLETKIITLQREVAKLGMYPFIYALNNPDNLI